MIYVNLIYFLESSESILSVEYSIFFLYDIILSFFYVSYSIELLLLLLLILLLLLLILLLLLYGTYIETFIAEILW